jgi:muramoyltetrapeptide carboxypeptidase
MKRKHFLSSIVPLAATLGAVAKGKTPIDPDSPVKVPPYLKRGDTIGICCPAGFITAEELQPALLKLAEWGFNTKIGETVGKKDFTYGGTDEERINDLQQMLDDKTIKAILFARGGYGGVRIIDSLNFKKFSRDPKWIIGFSDATVFHSHINERYRVATIHSKMCNSFPTDWSKAEPCRKKRSNPSANA